MLDAPKHPPIDINQIEVRRGPLGRWLVVPAGSPKNPNNFDVNLFDDAEELSWLREFHRPEKDARYQAKKLNPAYHGPRIIADGDSWFEYHACDDLIMVLSEKYAIRSLARAGDDWHDFDDQNKLFPAIEKERPNIVMLSLSGNEVMGKIATYVRDFAPDRKAEDYILPIFKPLLASIESRYNKLVARILSRGAQVILHGYDYPDARDFGATGAQWIGPPLKAERNIDGIGLVRGIANIMLDRFNDVLKRVAEKPANEGKVHYVNLRGTIGQPDLAKPTVSSLWTDEIHGSNEGFKLLAAKLDKKIKEISPA